MPDKLILFTYQAWADLDYAIDGLTLEEAATRYNGGSAIAWTVGHVTHGIAALINQRFLGLPVHPVFNRRFATGGSGEASDWPEILSGVAEVREAASQLLDASPAPDLDGVIVYDGSRQYLRESGLSLRWALMSIAAHHFLHVGEIVTIRSRIGRPVPDVPYWGRMLVE